MNTKVDIALDSLFHIDGNHKSLNEFNEIASEYNIFQDLTANERSSKLVADYWYSFSKLMPYLLISAASNISSLDQKTSLLQIAKEESGEEDGVAHFEMFEHACEMVKLHPKELELTCLQQLIAIVKNNHDSTILGICFGLEVIANENIEHLLKSLSTCDHNYLILEASLFFKIHRKNEDEHIRLNHMNYEKFCSSTFDRINFHLGFHLALRFWKSFWTDAKNLELCGLNYESKII